MPDPGEQRERGGEWHEAGHQRHQLVVGLRHVQRHHQQRQREREHRVAERLEPRDVVPARGGASPSDDHGPPPTFPDVGGDAGGRCDPFMCPSTSGTRSGESQRLEILDPRRPTRTIDLPCHTPSLDWRCRRAPCGARRGRGAAMTGFEGSLALKLDFGELPDEGHEHGEPWAGRPPAGARSDQLTGPDKCGCSTPAAPEGADPCPSPAGPDGRPR